MEQLLGERDTRVYGHYHFQDLGTLTMRKVPAELSRFTFLAPLAERCRRRVLEIELTRGDNPTAASAAALCLRSVRGVDNLVAILRALDERDFVRGWARYNESKETVFSHLVRCSFPREEETAAECSRKVKAANLSEDRLVGLAVYAPQWATCVEEALGWNGLRPSLEQFMVRGDEFTGAELRELLQHPLLPPMLQNLVVVGDGIAGYPVHDGKALENHRGEIEAVKASEKLRIAHPHDLLPSAQWHQWQKDCFARERIQPFKQVFRELYPLTEAVKQEGKQTRRYAGHQVQPRQAMALLGQRGWVAHPEEGVRKTFHETGLVAWLNFQESFYTPAQVEGLTLEGVFFTKRGGAATGQAR